MFASIILGLAALLGALQGSEVRVHYKDGKRVEGSILQETEKSIILEISLGLLQIDRERIDRVEELEDAAEGAKDPGAKTPAAPAPGGSPIAPDREKPQKQESAPKPELPPASAADTGEGTTDESATKAEASANPAPPGAVTYSGFSGRLIDRYSWATAMPFSTAITVLSGLFVLMWIGFGVGCRICDVSTGTAQTLASAALWTGITVGMLFIQGWSPVLIAGLVLTSGIAWLVTARGILGSTWFQVFSLGVLFVFGAGVTFLLVEVGQHLLELPTAG